MTWRNTILVGDVRELLATLPAESVHCVITSPPYWGLRDYGTASWVGGDDACEHKREVEPRTARPMGALHGGTDTVEAQDGGKLAYRDACGKCGATRIDSQLGIEPTPEAYVENLVAIFREVRRVLRADGTCWLNLGDSYATSNAGQHSNGRGMTHGPKHAAARDSVRLPRIDARRADIALKPKDLVGIPWLVAFALRDDGWWLRSEVIWSKPNPMPESITDRPTKAHESLFLLTKSERYFYDAEAIKEPSLSGPSDVRKMLEGRARIGGLTREQTDPMLAGSAFTNIGQKRGVGDPSGRNRRSVWEIEEDEYVQFLAWKAARSGERCDVWRIGTQPYAEAHFATYPEALVLPCVQAGTSERGVCSDCGAPWRRVVIRTAMVVRDSGRAAMLGKLGETVVSGMMLSAPSARTVGWRPECACYDARYRAMPRARRDRKRRHQNAVDDALGGAGGWWQRVRSRPGLGTWPTSKAVTLDPFMGSGTTGLVAYNAGRDFVGVELNPTYAALALKRIEPNRGRLL